MKTSWHVIFGVPGSTDTFEYFVDDIKQRVAKQDVTLDNATKIIADHVLEIKKKRNFNKSLYFD